MRTFNAKARTLAYGAIVAALAAGGGCPNLVPQPRLPDLTGPIAYCNLTDAGDGLFVIIKNTGSATAAASTTRVTFTSLPTGDHVVDLPTPSIAAGAEVTLGPILFSSLPSNCFQADCAFTITADANDVVTESSEANTVSGRCIG